MAKEIRARVGRGALELLEDIDLPEGKEVTVTILDAPSRAEKEAFRHAAGGWKGQRSKRMPAPSCATMAR